MIGLLHQVYQDVMLRALIGEGNSFISEGMISIYEKHRSDLRKLKDVLLPYHDLYKAMFSRVKRDSYTGYIKNDRQHKNRVSTYKPLKQDELYKAIKSTLEKVEDSELKTEILSDIEEGKFLPKINSTKNSAIPYQLNLAELRVIIKNQAKYYPELKERADKIESILTFRRPYSVGVIVGKDRSRFSWFDEDMVPDERVYPWNFEQLIDIDRASENFIKRMTSRCKFFPEEFVLPLNSCIYQKYIVLNELNKIKIVDEFGGQTPLTVEQKQAVFNQLFLKNKTVSAKSVLKYLYENFGVNTYKCAISGLSGEDGKKFLGKMSSYIELKQHLSAEQFADGDLVEKIIEDITVFSDKKIRKRALKKLGLNEDQVDKLCKLNYSGWGRFSQKLLTGIKSNNGESILDLMYDTNENFNQIIYSEEYGFKEQLFKEQDAAVKPNYSSVRELYLSPAVKRAVWQSLKIVNEIVKINGKAPLGIYIESTRTDDKKTRTKTRYEKLALLYANVEKDVNYYNASVVKGLKTIEEKSLDSDMVYLYHLQMGKSMYSGKPLGDIASLSTRCEIDHVIPQCFIKDDSVENRVLVLKEENQLKSGDLVLNAKIREQMKPFWEYLYKNHMMSKKKFYELQRREYTEKDQQGFISRQLVETNQSVKAVRDLFARLFPESDVELVKAGISSVFRRSLIKDGYLSFIKLRELNDMHHAKDAYLACAIARFTRKIYPIWGADSQARLLKNEMYAFGENVDVKKLVNDRNGIVVDAMKFGKADTVKLSEGGTIDWNTCYNNILTAFDYNDCLVTKQMEITAESAFYNATIYGKNEPSAKGDLPLRQIIDRNGDKRDLPAYYGNYSSEKCSYFLNVTYQKGKNVESKLMGVPVKVTYQAKKDPDAVYSYFNKTLNDKKCALLSVDKQVIMRFQPISYNGHYCFIASDSYLWNAVQLVVDKRFNPLIYAVSNPQKQIVLHAVGAKRYVDDREFFEPQMKEFILYHADKVRRLYPLYAKLADGIENYVLSGEFDKLPYFDAEKRIDKARYLTNILKLTRAGSTQLDMKNFGGVIGWGTIRTSSIGKKKTIMYYQSVTGLYEQKVLPTAERK